MVFHLVFPLGAESLGTEPGTASADQIRVRLIFVEELSKSNEWVA